MAAVGARPPTTSRHRPVKIASADVRGRLLGPGHAGRWLTETRAVDDDYKRIYGEEPPEDIRLITLAIDSNDTRSIADSCVGEIFFGGRE